MSHTLTVYLTDHGIAGHSFVGIADENGKTEYWGYYPHAAPAAGTLDAPLSVDNITGRVYGVGEVRNDSYAFDHYDLTASEPITLTDEQYETVHNYIQSRHDSPGNYNAVHENCVDFANDVLHAAGYQKEVGNLFSNDQLRASSLAGRYAEAEAIYHENIPDAGPSYHIPGKGEWASGIDSTGPGYTPQFEYTPQYVPVFVEAPSHDTKLDTLGRDIAHELKEELSRGLVHDAPTHYPDFSNGGGIINEISQKESPDNVRPTVSIYHENSSSPANIYEHPSGLHIDPIDSAPTPGSSREIVTLFEPLSYNGVEAEPTYIAHNNNGMVMSDNLQAADKILNTYDQPLEMTRDIMPQDDSVISRIASYVNDIVNPSSSQENHTAELRLDSHEAQPSVPANEVFTQPVGDTGSPLLGSDIYSYEAQPSVPLNDAFAKTPSLDSGNVWGTDWNSHEVQSAPLNDSFAQPQSIDSGGAYGNDWNSHETSSVPVNDIFASTPAIDSGNSWGTDSNSHETSSVTVTDIFASTPAIDTGNSWGTDSNSHETPSVPMNDIFASTPSIDTGNSWGNHSNSHETPSVPMNDIFASTPSIDTGNSWGNDWNSHETPSVPANDIFASTSPVDTGNSWGNDWNSHETPSVPVNDILASTQPVDTGNSWGNDWNSHETSSVPVNDIFASTPAIDSGGSLGNDWSSHETQTSMPISDSFTSVQSNDSSI